MRKLSLPASCYVGFITLIGFGALIHAATQWRSEDLTKLACYLLLAVLGDLLDVGLPAAGGTLTLSLLFILIGFTELSQPETLLIGFAGALIQLLRSARRGFPLVEGLFSIGNLALATVAARLVFQSGLLVASGFKTPMLLVVASLCLFHFHTLATAGVRAAMEGVPIATAWRDQYFRTLPNYVFCAALAACYHALTRVMGWQVSVLVVSIAYLVYRSYWLHVSKVRGEQRHIEAMMALHIRTIEALALAIEAKDDNTHDHLQRVQVYCIEIGQDLGLSPDDMEALRTASVLHDIGKLAVPEHIITKPGKLTPEEFDKMKIHPVVGAELLERVQFPYPVVPIVRAHHERWNGSGYPDGLKAEEIPIGARILAAVDCLDAMASDRQYRKALPLDEAMARIVSESGTSFDPKVVEVLQRRYVELERLAQKKRAVKPRLSTEIKVERGLAPAAGLEKSISLPPSRQEHDKRPQESFLASIAAARGEVQTLFELAQALGNSLSLDDTLSVLAVRLKRMVPFDTLVVFLRREGVLTAEHVSGENARLFYALRIPVGEGLSGWVVENCKPIVNGDPSVEPGYHDDNRKNMVLRSALSVPLEGTEGVVGALTLYRTEKDAFMRDHLRILQAITAKVSVSIENALKYKRAEHGASTDHLTGLPNARALFEYLDNELGRCRRSDLPLAVLVCDLDGFKLINDQFGHLVGNRVLQNVATSLRHSCRSYDYVARMGGDEFVIVMPGLKQRDIAPRLDQLANAVQGAGMEAVGVSMLSVSTGAAHFPEDGSDVEHLLAEADRRMYKVKKSMVRTRRRPGGGDFEASPVL